MTEETEDDLFVLFGAILNRINEVRKKNNEPLVYITDAERMWAIRDYVNTYPNDKILWGEYQ